MIAEFSTAVLQVIVSSRSSSGVVSTSSVNLRDGWFNLRIGECPPGVDNAGGALYEKRGGRSNWKVIERWVLHYDTGKGEDSVKFRLLPAYKTTRAIASSNHSCSYSLAHRVSSFAEPFNDKEDEGFQQFGFSPVDVVNGRLCLSVLYHLSTFDARSYPSVPLPPRIIPNYIGSAFADPLKRLPLLSVARLHKPTLTRTGSAPVTAISPPIDSVRQSSKHTKRRSHVIRNGPAIEEIVSERRNGSIAKHEEVIPSQISFIKCYHQPSWKEFEYDEITCPFDVDDDYSLSRFSYRPQSSDRRGREYQHDKQGSVSQDAFVGALVDMLKRAPPLREESQDLVNLPQPSPNKTVLLKTTADAMEELKSYRKMKCLLMGP
ncbi:hypothetical protein MLD38_018193 [Melastoma candidum]|uniref:Uncharacterized protein n=1 Tax=Melastoma candidum TaxID=119954 RepID=A0ACB9QT29_9MYRT|nr:hypothetical protein MLD38_018193 [Melastoma candidum]